MKANSRRLRASATIGRPTGSPLFCALCLGLCCTIWVSRGACAQPPKSRRSINQEQSFYAALLTMDATYELMILARCPRAFRALDTLLDNSAIKRELELTASQSQEIKGVFASSRDSVEKQKSLLRGPNGRRVPLQEYESLTQSISMLKAQAPADAIAVLKASQRERLSEIVIQAMGTLAAAHPAVGKRARIESPRLYKMQKVIRETHLKIRLLDGPIETLTGSVQIGSYGAYNYYLRQYNVLFLKGNADLDHILGECEARISKLIPPSQRPKLDRLGGKPFDFSVVENPPHKRPAH